MSKDKKADKKRSPKRPNADSFTSELGDAAATLQQRAYGVKEAAILLNVSVPTLRREISRGNLRYIQTDNRKGGKVLISIQAIQEYLGDR
jgi:excisionase family DNA binding protein